MKEGSREEMDQHIQKMREDAEQERRERRQASHTTFVGTLIQSAEGGAKMIHQVTKPTPWRGGATPFSTPEGDANEGELELSFMSGPHIGQLVKRYRIKISLRRIKS